MRKGILTAILLVLATAGTVLAQDEMARVRVAHASPDAPAVDVLVNDSVAFSNIPFTEISDYASLDPGTYNVKVVPAGETEPVVIEADLTLEADTDYTVAAVGELANIEPVVLVDDNTLPAAGMAKVRFMHASPDAPNVDIQVADGPVLFENVPFKEAFPYATVDAGTYDLEAAIHDSGAVALEVPGVEFSERTVYTVFAMGLAGGDPALQAVASVDATAPALPATGGTSPALLIALVAAAAGVGLAGIGLYVRREAIRA